MASLDEEYIKKNMMFLILIVLLVLSFFLLKPLLLSIILGIILAFVFNPLYEWLSAITKAKNISAAIICVIFALIIILPVWFLTPIVLEQSFKIYQEAQHVDFITPLKKLFPDIFASEAFSNELGNALQSFIVKAADYIVNIFTNLIINLPTILLQLLVVFFTFFFVLRDKKLISEYIKSLLPFSREVEDKIFEYSRGITNSVIYGQIIIGFIQGVIVGIGFFASSTPNALFLTLISIIAGILPIVGPFLIWAPVAIYLFVAGNTNAALIVALFGLIASTIDNILRPLITSKMTRMHSALVLIGMIGGLFIFGVLGFILGPLILAYLFIVLEIYRRKKTPGVFIEESNNK